MFLVIIDEAYIDFVTSVEVKANGTSVTDEFSSYLSCVPSAYGPRTIALVIAMSSVELANYIQNHSLRVI